MAAFQQGQLVRLSVAFTVASTATDPTAVTLKIRTPSNSTVTYTYGTDGALVKDSTGNYHLDYTVAAKGLHIYRWAGTGAVVAAEEGSFTGKDTAF